ncbi:MAG TPA: hypothetical protein VGO69_10570, partial [Pyrinomonadaceae bacterium]|nr:hypothetical protein [Pyrinomonadaceae bacterium]
MYQHFLAFAQEVCDGRLVTVITTTAATAAAALTSSATTPAAVTAGTIFTSIAIGALLSITLRTI